MNHPPYDPHESPRGFWRSRHAVGLLVIGAIAAYFLLTEHLAHVMGALPYLLLAACPLMHLFMHHGHGRHEGRHEPPGSDSTPNKGSLPGKGESS